MKLWIYDWNMFPTPTYIDIDPTISALMAWLKFVFEIDSQAADETAVSQRQGSLKRDWYFAGNYLYDPRRPKLEFRRIYGRGHRDKQWICKNYLEVRLGPTSTPIVVDKHGNLIKYIY